MVSANIIFNRKWNILVIMTGIVIMTSCLLITYFTINFIRTKSYH